MNALPMCAVRQFEFQVFGNHPLPCDLIIGRISEISLVGETLSNRLNTASAGNETKTKLNTTIVLYLDTFTS